MLNIFLFYRRFYRTENTLGEFIGEFYSTENTLGEFIGEFYRTENTLENLYRYKRF